MRHLVLALLFACASLFGGEALAKKRPIVKRSAKSKKLHKPPARRGRGRLRKTAVPADPRDDLESAIAQKKASVPVPTASAPAPARPVPVNMATQWDDDEVPGTRMKKK
jgi:hypothetical protein